MIPEYYWYILRRWFWLIAVFGIAGAALGVYGMPYLIGETPGFDSSATVAVSHYVSPTRIVTTGESDATDTVVADYTEALAVYSTTPQFRAAVQQGLAARGLTMSLAAIEHRLRVDSTPELFRLNVHATGSSQEMTDALVTVGADELIQRARDEEARVAFGLVANLDQQRDELVTRLDDLSTRREELLRREITAAGPPLADRPEVTRIAENVPLLTGSGQALVAEMADLLTAVAQILGDPELIVIDVEIQTLESEIRDLTEQSESVLANRTYTAPVALLNPTETVQSGTGALAARDMMVLGGAIGLVVGWGVANLGDRLRKGKRVERPEPFSVIEREGEDTRLRVLVERSAEVERRARALSTSLNGTDGRPAPVVAGGSE